MITRLLCLITVLLCPSAFAWQSTLDAARGQTLYFYGWGGNTQVNRYLEWVRDEVAQQYGITLEHVKVADISDAVTLIINDKLLADDSAGHVDLLWVNGENFAKLKELGLLYGPFTDALPNMALTNPELPLDRDFSVAVEGLEAPWGVGQLGFLFDQNKTPVVPTNAVTLLQYAREHPGRISYPQPPQFHGMAFLKQLLWELADDPEALQHPVTDSDFAQVTAPLWHYLDQLHEVAWYRGRRFPQSDRHMIQLMADGELHMALTFNPGEGPAAVQRGDLPPSVRQQGFEPGALTNIHFLAIPFSANAKPAAQVVVNFLLSPTAQARKADLEYWGDPSVLAPSHLPAQALPLNTGIAEPHFSWQQPLQQAWRKRYGF